MPIDQYGRNACKCGFVPPTHTHAADCTMVQHQSMPDSLRDRIAAVIESALDSPTASASGYGSEYVSNTGDGTIKLDGEFDISAVADAVIAALGLKRDPKYPRWVTDWLPDENTRLPHD